MIKNVVILMKQKDFSLIGLNSPSKSTLPTLAFILSCSMFMPPMNIMDLSSHFYAPIKRFPIFDKTYLGENTHLPKFAPIQRFHLAPKTKIVIFNCI